MNTRRPIRTAQRLDVRLRRRFFRQLLYGTLVFCVVPVALVVVLSSTYYTNRIVEEFRHSKHENLNAVMLENARLLQEFSVYIKYATDRDLIYFGSHSFHDDIVRFQQLFARLSSQVAASEHIDSLHFYSGAHGYLVTVSPGGYRFARLDSLSTAGTAAPPDTGWMSAMDEQWFFRPFYRSDYDGEGESLSFIVPIFDRDAARSTALIANIRLDSIVTQTRHVSRDDGGNTYLVSDGTIVPLIESFPLSYGTVSPLTEPDEIVSLASPAGPLLVASALDPNTGLRFVSIVPRGRLTRDLRSILATYYAMVLVFTALVVVMGWVYTRRLYRPVEQVLELVSSREGDPRSHGDRTVLQHIAGEYRRVADQNASLKARIESSREVVRDHVVDELLRGHVIANIETMVPELGVDTAGTSYVVLVVHAERDVASSTRYEAVAEVQRALVDIVGDELDEKGVRGLVYALSSGEVAVIAEYEQPQPGGRLGSFMQALADHASSALGIDVHVGASERVNGLEHVTVGYRQAIEALQNGILELTARVHTHEELKRAEHQRIESNRIVSRFAEAVAQTDDDQAAATFASDLVANAQHQSGHHAEVQAICIESVISIMDYAERRSVTDAKRDLARFCENITACRTSGEMVRVISDVLSGIVGTCRAMSYPNGAVDANVARTLGYVETHFAENIGLENVADAIGLNPSYLSRIFKRITGTAFHDHLARVRVGEARRLLEQTNDPVYEVARTVGFGSALTLKRNFRRIEGCTPNEYRARHAHVTD